MSTRGTPACPAAPGDVRSPADRQDRPTTRRRVDHAGQATGRSRRRAVTAVRSPIAGLPAAASSIIRPDGAGFFHECAPPGHHAHLRSPPDAGGAHDSLSAGARRPARPGGDRRPAVPRRRQLDDRRLPRRLGVLHPVGVPDHVAAGPRDGDDRPGGRRPVLRPPGATVAAGQPGVHRRGVPCWPPAGRSRASAGCARRARGAAAGVQLGEAGQRAELRRPDHGGVRAAPPARPLLVVVDRGAVLLGVAGRRPRAAAPGPAPPALDAAALAGRALRAHRVAAPLIAWQWGPTRRTGRRRPGPRRWSPARCSRCGGRRAARSTAGRPSAVGSAGSACPASSCSASPA